MNGSKPPNILNQEYFFLFQINIKFQPLLADPTWRIFAPLSLIPANCLLKAE